MLKLLRCISLIIAGLATAQCTPEDSPRFAIFIVDEGAGGTAQRVPTSNAENGAPGAMWLEREGGMEGPFVADARVGQGVDGTSVVDLTLTAEGRARFAALTRANIGRRLAMVVNGTVIVASLIGAEIADGRVMISGGYTEAEARALAAELMATGAPASP